MTRTPHSFRSVCAGSGEPALRSDVCVSYSPDWSMEIVELCKKYRHEGVVAIDLAGDESLCSETNPDHRRAYEVSGTGF